MINDHGPAFPTTARVRQVGDLEYEYDNTEGITMRDWFAHQAMCTLWNELDWVTYPDQCADRCYAVADAMLRARDR